MPWLRGWEVVGGGAAWAPFWAGGARPWSGGGRAASPSLAPATISPMVGPTPPLGCRGRCPALLNVCLYTGLGMGLGCLECSSREFRTFV